MTGSRTRLRGRKEVTVLSLACMACGEMFETGGFKVSDIDAAVDEHVEKTEGKV